MNCSKNFLQILILSCFHLCHKLMIWISVMKLDLWKTEIWNYRRIGIFKFERRRFWPLVTSISLNNHRQIYVHVFQKCLNTPSPVTCSHSRRSRYCGWVEKSGGIWSNETYTENGILGSLILGWVTVGWVFLQESGSFLWTDVLKREQIWFKLLSW